MEREGAAISGHLVIRTARGRLFLGRAAGFPIEVQRIAQLGQRAALATLARDPGALAQIRLWPGRNDLGSDITGLDDHDLLGVVRRDVANRRLLIFEMHDAVPTITVPLPATNRAMVAKPPPGMTLTAAQEADAAVAAMDSMDKVIAALQRSAKYMGPELSNAFQQLFTLDNLKILAAFFIAGALANTNPVSAVVFDAAMLAMVFYLAGSAGIAALGLLITTTIAVIAAKSEADLDRGGEGYAKAFVGLGGAVFMAWLARRIIKEKNTGGPSKPKPAEPGEIVWPPNRGFEGAPVARTLPRGTRVDRYGYEGGTFVSPVGTPVSARSLAPGTTAKPYNVYEVVKPIEVQSGKVAPWFGEVGKGTQYELPMSVGEAVAKGYLTKVGP